MPATAIFGRSPTTMSTLSLHGDPARFPTGLQELGEGVWAWTQPNGGLGESNAGLVRGEGQSLLVDTLWDLRLTGTMLARMAEATAQAPIRRVVNTHGDGDHCWGNQLLAGAELIGTEACARDVAAEDPRGVRVLGKAASVVGMVAEHAPAGLPGVEQGVGLGAFASQLAPFDFDGVEATPPTHTFQGSLELDVGGRAVHVIEVGPAHTPGDAIVHVPDARVVFAADVMFIGVCPIMWSGSVERWQAALERITELDPVHVVPGHGPVTDLEGVREMAAYWDFVTPAVRGRLAAGRSPEDAAREVIASPEYAEQPFAAWDGPERLIVSADAIARNDGGEVGRPGDVARLGLLAAMGKLAVERTSAG
jgi:cyclase